MEYEYSPDLGNMPDLNRGMNRSMPRTQPPGSRMPDNQTQDNRTQDDSMSNVDRMENENVFPVHVSLAMAYVPYQPFENLFDPETALRRGTLFKAFDLPFYGGNGGRK